MKKEISIDFSKFKRKRGRPNKANKESFEREVDKLCAVIVEIDSTLDFRMSSRGWCYHLEEIGANKGQFDVIQRTINDCRKDGRLFVDICADDDSRSTDGLEFLDEPELSEEADYLVNELIDTRIELYTPISFWEFQKFYVEIFVEKIDLKELFKQVTEKYHVPITNCKGWADLLSRADVIGRINKRQQEGKQCVILYCGDFDPKGLQISQSLNDNLRDMLQARWRNGDPVKCDVDSLIIERFGLNYDFIEKNKLSWTENLITGGKKSNGKPQDLADPKHPDHYKAYVQDYIKQYGVRKVEANALVVRPDAGRKLCEKAIRKYVKPSGIKKYDERLNTKREELRDLVGALMR